MYALPNSEKLFLHLMNMLVRYNRKFICRKIKETIYVTYITKTITKVEKSKI